MPGMNFQSIRLSALLLLILFPGFVLADQSPRGKDLASKPMLLEVRYCECEATRPDRSPSELLPGFLKASNSLEVGVGVEDEGFVASDVFSLGYRVSPIEDEPGTFKLTWASSYSRGSDWRTAEGKLALVKGEWVQLYGSRNESDAGTQHTGVAVRLVESTDE
ncbi:MAG: hypothetical protein R6W87_06510 [Halospina sp.]